MILLQFIVAVAPFLLLVHSAHVGSSMTAWAPSFAEATGVAHQQARDVTGKWVFAVTTENGTGYPTVVLKQEGDKVTGTYESTRLGLRNLEGTIKGDTLRLTMKSAGEGMLDFTFIGVVVDKDNVKGTLEMGGMGSATFTGKRQ